MNIDKKKLKEAIAEINRRRKFDYWPRAPQWKDYPDYNTSEATRKKYYADLLVYQADAARSTAEWATLLYSLQAHSRGYLHMVKQWVPTYGADGGQRLVSYTMDDQTKLIAPLLAEFEMTAEQLEARDRRRFDAYQAAHPGLSHAEVSGALTG